MMGFAQKTDGALCRLREHYSDIQTYSQQTRFAVASLLHALFAEHRAPLARLGEEALLGVLDLVHGEKDPRILMLNFSILRVIATEWELGSHMQV
jgi:DNA repair/transcription protein MET18/MMS19